ncbi:hypothetical protein [Lactobacillus sp.]|uniref:hypothetical protein n=1 Tax=Lactobacillus sp. TaxID=1591 RepID=UPI001986D755|nr:hypothetical protein [Lactobacillus sp.]MBD5429990.1 hypothetical protein [Lactobacillus sp.]
MRKTKIIGAAVAALLAVAPIGVAPFVNAATNTTENSNTVVSEQPQFSVTYKQGGKDVTADPNNQIFQVAVGSKFDPTKILGSNGDTFTITAGDAKITVDQNNVDTSKPGSFSTVKLTATNSKGKQTTISYEVLVTPATGGYTLNVTPNYNTPGYNIFSDT